MKWETSSLPALLSWAASPNGPSGWRPSSLKPSPPAQAPLLTCLLCIQALHDSMEELAGTITLHYGFHKLCLTSCSSCLRKMLSYPNFHSLTFGVARWSLWHFVAFHGFTYLEFELFFFRGRKLFLLASKRKPHRLQILGVPLIWRIICCCGCVVTKSCLTLWHPRHCSPPGSSVHGISQARILEWAAISFSRGSSQSGDQTRVSCIGRWIPNHQATWEAMKHNKEQQNSRVNFTVAPAQGLSTSEGVSSPCQGVTDAVLLGMWGGIITNWYWSGPMRNSIRTVILYIPPKNSEQKHFSPFLPRGRNWSSESFGDLPGSHSLSRVPHYLLQNPNASSWMNEVTPQTKK